MSSSSPLGPLGAVSRWPSFVDASVLFAIPRDKARALAKLEGHRPLAPEGCDVWTAWEFTWRDPSGRPYVSVLQLTVPFDSPNIVESKSLKLYLHGYAQNRFERGAVLQQLRQDIGSALGREPLIELIPLNDSRLQVRTPPAVSIDELLDANSRLPEEISKTALRADFLNPREADVHLRRYVSHAFGSLCPVTAQPDWASVFVLWKGRGPTPEALMAYLDSFRSHQGFHEACVEEIWSDLWSHGQLDALCVSAQFTRRGGIDITPMRTSSKTFALPWVRLSRC